MGVRWCCLAWSVALLLGCGTGAGGGGSQPGSTDADAATRDLHAGGGPSPDDPEAASRDSDCDGLSDAEEFSLVWPGGAHTDPSHADSDGDGLPDGLEAGRSTSVDPRCAFAGDRDPRSTTLPTVADTDNDGLPDGIEDGSHDGRVDPGETDPRSPESDGDGLLDGFEDDNHDGRRDPGETDPRLRDTDGDGIGDGAELRVTRTNPRLADTDRDGCPDGAEDLDQDGLISQGETDPKNPADCSAGAMAIDTDHDGIPDAVEDRNHDGVVDPGETDPRAADSDNDLLPDGVEDRDHDGRVDPGETDPRSLDSDCDGLLDGPTQGRLLGEDEDRDGEVDHGETNPRILDSDGDGLGDGVERGVTANRDPAHCKVFLGDSDPLATTDPLAADSDGDGVLDGAEDANGNGRLDPGELDPRNPNDGGGPVAKACARLVLRPVVFPDEEAADVRLALSDRFAEVVTMKVAGTARGLLGWSAADQVAFLAFRQPAPQGSTGALDDEAALRAAIAALGGLDNATTRSFTTWDGHGAVQAFYDQGGNLDVKAQANALAEVLVGMGAGALPGKGNAVGPFRLQLEVVHRSARSVVVVLALTSAANFVEPALFQVGDTAGGSAVAQFGDGDRAQCEPFVPSRGAAADFLFVVDDSGSMQGYQAALGATASAMQAALDNAALDWRVAVVTTSLVSQNRPNSGVVRGFTRNPVDFANWLTQGQPGWIGISGDGTERCLEAAARAISDMTPGPLVNELPSRFRGGASIHVILLGDADDQSVWNAQQYLGFFGRPGGMVGGYANGATSPITVHGIVCPAGQGCGETQQNPQRHGEVIAGTGGVRGDITGNRSIPATMDAIVRAAISSAGHRLQRPPIGATIKVALDAVDDPLKCNGDDLPRSRLHGFDFDGVSRSLSLFGACRPSPKTTRAAVSYRYWADATPRPDGPPRPCEDDPFFDERDADFCRGRLACDRQIDQCVCPPDCGGTVPPGTICNRNLLVCDFVCAPDCGGRCTGQTRCQRDACGCACQPSASCPAGTVFSSANGQCGCVCDDKALRCATGFEADPASCTCRCRKDCGGCAKGTTCNPSRCLCEARTG